MTNMQHYMEDIQDILEDLDTEMEKRFKRIGKWDKQIEEWTEESDQLEKYVFDVKKPKEKREEKALKLADLRGKMRALSERKVQLCEKNQKTMQAIYKRISGLAYNCKCEVEIDNPGSTEIRERLFEQMNGYTEIEADHTDGHINISSSIPSGIRTREMSIMTDEDAGKKVGRSRTMIKEAKSNYSSARSSVERENGKKSEKMSNYMRKKHEKMKEQQRLEEMKFEKEKNLDLIKRELLDGTDFDFGGETSIAGIARTAEEEEEQELLRFLIPENDGRLPSPPRDIMESLDATDTGMFSMDWSNQPEIKPATFTQLTNTTTNMKRPNATSSPFELIEKRKRNHLFGSIADTSFSGRPRKLTDRVSEMMQNSREREEKRNRKKETDEWCICDGNVNSEMMVQCDNANCKIEWYHFECVGLCDSPYDTWYCPYCSQISPHLRVPRPRDE